MPGGSSLANAVAATGWFISLALIPVGAVMSIHSGTAVFDPVQSLTAAVTGYALGVGITGFFHWLEDNYFSPETPWIGKGFIAANRLHHEKPMAMVTRHSWLGNIGWRLFVPMTALNLASTRLYRLNLGATTIAIAVGIVGHRWVHDSKRPRVIQWAQEHGLFPTYEQHKVHHECSSRGYFIVPSTLDVVADTLRFWRGVEWLVYQLTGVQAQSRHGLAGKTD